MSTCPLCTKPIVDKDIVTVIMAAQYLTEAEGYKLHVYKQAILSHVVCPQESK